MPIKEENTECPVIIHGYHRDTDVRIRDAYEFFVFFFFNTVCILVHGYLINPRFAADFMRAAIPPGFADRSYPYRDRSIVIFRCDKIVRCERRFIVRDDRDFSRGCERRQSFSQGSSRKSQRNLFQ